MLSIFSKVSEIIVIPFANDNVVNVKEKKTRKVLISYHSNGKNSGFIVSAKKFGKMWKVGIFGEKFSIVIYPSFFDKGF